MPPMATTTKSKKTATPEPPQEVPQGDLPLHIDRKRQIRLGTGIFFLLLGVLSCFSIFSYFFTWAEDQDKVAHIHNFGSFFKFIFFENAGIDKDVIDKVVIANHGGRAGAAIAHVLVYKGAGIAAIAICCGIASVGINLIYGKKALGLMRYMRWLSILLLLLAPILSFLLPNSAFPFGGALGKVSIDYFTGVMGYAGTGMLLLSTVLFFVFVIFALDIGPFLKKMREQAAKMAASMKPEPEDESEPEEKVIPVAAPVTAVAAEPVKEKNIINAGEDVSDVLAPIPPTSNKLKGNAGNNIPLVIENGVENKEWDMGLVEKQAEIAHTEAGAMEDEEPPFPEDEEEDDFGDENDWPEEEEDLSEQDKLLDRHEPVMEEVPVEETIVEDEEPELSFEVQQPVAAPKIQHGAHISIGSNEPYAPELDLPDYKFPTLDLLENRTPGAISMNKEELERNKDQIVQTLNSFGIEIQQITATIGPTVTLYEIVPAKGVRISKIKNLEDDIALSLAALGIRIIAPIPGKGTIGIEVPNANKQIVSMLELLASDKFVNNKMSLPIALGKKIDNENYIVDLATMPHLLMAGATGQGKSVGINAILVSLLYKKHPSQLKFVMVDPKKVELSIYRIIEKHFLAKLPNEEEPIITDIKKVIYTLKALCDEMDDRYGLLKDAGTRNIKEYNEKFIARRLNPENGHKYLPFIVLVIDEFADLIMTAGKEVEMPIARLAQLARAVGIHIIIATQRPSVNVITGTIKANFPARIAFKVSAKVDSRTILDTGGAEQLVGRGDMLISHGSELLRIQCAFVDTPEVENIVNFIGNQRGYPKAHALPEPEMDDEDGGGKNVDLKNRDKLFEECARTVVQMQSGSTSNLQRRFNLGYNRAGRIMDQLEAANIVGPAAGSKPREVYYKSETELEGFLGTLS